MGADGLTTIFGGASIGEGKAFPTEETISELYKVLKANGTGIIDTARLYGNSEEWTGKTKGGDLFTIHSKTPGGFIKGGSTSSGILQHAKETVERLGVKKVAVYYIHAPDASLDLEDMLKGINDAHQAGYFDQFGLSNFQTEEVERVHRVCQEKGYVLPTVFQGNYNPIGRKIETDLFPTLRKLNIAFYAYSPLAGGFLNKTKEQIQGGGEEAGRFAKGHQLNGVYGPLYDKPAYLKALDLWADAANEAGVGKAELAYRWVAFNSPLDRKYGDAIIFGASRLSQVEETQSWLHKGPLSERTKQKIDEIWDVVKDEAILNNFYG